MKGREILYTYTMRCKDLSELQLYKHTNRYKWRAYNFIVKNSAMRINTETKYHWSK